MELAITKIMLSPNPVEIMGKIKISVTVKEITQEPIMYRLPFTVGRNKGGIK